MIQNCSVIRNHLFKNVSISIFSFLGKNEGTSASLHIKVKDPKKFITPSPGAYNPQNADKETRTSAAVYSFGIKSDVKKVGHSPGG